MWCDLISALCAALLLLQQVEGSHHGVSLAPLYGRDQPNVRHDHYIVVFDEGYSHESHFHFLGRRLSRILTTSPGYISYKYLPGYHAKMDASTLRKVRRDRRVSFVQSDRSFPAQTAGPPSPHNRRSLHDDLYEPSSDFASSQHANSSDDMDTLDRRSPGFDLAKMKKIKPPKVEIKIPDVVDQVKKQLNEPIIRKPGRYFASQKKKTHLWNLIAVAAPKDLLTKWLSEKDGATIEYLFGRGHGTHVFVLSTGIRTSHYGFGGRASNFGGASEDAQCPYVKGETWADGNGLGTSIAGVVGAAPYDQAGINIQMYGIAGQAKLISVKVMSKSGELTDLSILTKAIDDVIEAHEKLCAAHQAGWEFRGSVMLLPFLPRYLSADDTDDNKALNTALERAKTAGLQVIAPAGDKSNEISLARPLPACPTFEDPGICVGAVNESLQITKRSNWGPSVEILAPGKNIRSLSNGADDGTSVSSGTALAAAHVAGIASIFVSWRGLADEPVKPYLLKNALEDVCHFGDFQLSQDNLLANTGFHHPGKHQNSPFRMGQGKPSNSLVFTDTGFQGIEMKEEGFQAREMRRKGFQPNEMKEEGFQPIQMVDECSDANLDG